jgi:hypothetical protein
LKKPKNFVKKGEEWHVSILLEVLFIQAASLDKNVTDLVRIAVGRRSTILKVATLILSNISWDSD